MSPQDHFRPVLVLKIVFLTGVVLLLPGSTGPRHNVCIIGLQMMNVPRVALIVRVRVRVG